MSGTEDPTLQSSTPQEQAEEDCLFLGAFFLRLRLVSPPFPPSEKSRLRLLGTVFLLVFLSPTRARTSSRLPALATAESLRDP